MKANVVIEALQALEQVEADGSRLVKEQVLAQHKDNLALQWMLYYTYGPEKYHVYPSVAWRDGDPIEPAGKLNTAWVEANWLRFVEMLRQLANREITGNAAQALVDEFFGNCYWLEMKWFTRAMNHDMRCGVSVCTINHVWDSKYFWMGGSQASGSTANASSAITFPGTMLCAKYPGWNGLGSRLVEPKLDGYRLCLVMYNGEYSFYTRSGHCDPYNANLKHIVDQLHAAGIDNVMLDGELMHDDWNKTGLIKRKSPSPAEVQEIQDKVLFYVFDYIDWNGDNGHTVKQEDRKVELLALLDAKPTDELSWSTKIKGVRTLAWVDVKSSKDLDEFYVKCLAEGHEGVVIKDPISCYNYTGKRTAAWMKHKPLETVDAQIVGFEAGSVGKRNEHRLGALQVQTAEGLWFKVGIGFSDAVREDFWNNQKSYLGKWVEAKYQAGTVADGRFGKFVRMRDDLND